MGALRPFANGQKNVRAEDNYKNCLTGELLIDMKVLMQKNRMK
jgi:hypothetical protein